MDPGRLSVFEQRAQLDDKFLEKVAKELNIPMEAITEIEEGAVVNIFSGTFSNNQSAVIAGQVSQPVFNPIQKLVEVFEKMLDERDQKIAALEAQLKDKK